MLMFHLIKQQQKMQNKEVPIEINIPQSQLIKMQEVMRDKVKIQRKNSVDRKTSVKGKKLYRESSMFNKDSMNVIENLSILFANVERYSEEIEQFCEKREIHFLIQLKSKMVFQEYKGFLSTLELYKMPQNGKLIQEGKYHNFHYILLEGGLTAYSQRKAKDQEKEYIEMFEYEVGEIIYSNMLQTHKANPYTLRTTKPSFLLRFKDDSFIKYLKKICTKEMDELAVLLAHTLVFKPFPAAQIKKFLPYCSIKRFRYNQMVYGQGDLIKQLFLVLDGETQISYERQDKNKNTFSKTLQSPAIIPNFHRTNHQPTEKKQIKVVKVGRKQLFGLEALDVFSQNYYEHHAKVASNRLKVLAIGLNVLFDMETQNPALEANLNMYLKKVNQIHCRLLEKNENIAFNIPQKKKKRKTKQRRRTKNSLEWWGLAAKIEDTRKYKLPTPPKTQSAKQFMRKEPLLIAQRTTKLEYFKRRLFEDEIEAIQAASEKQNNQPTYQMNGLIPRLNKMKIKMINLNPRVVNNAERVKKKLLEYAKNGEVFCDKLQLE